MRLSNSINEALSCVNEALNCVNEALNSVNEVPSFMHKSISRLRDQHSYDNSICTLTAATVSPKSSSQIFA